MKETPPSSEQRPADRFRWLPIPLLAVFPFLIVIFSHLVPAPAFNGDGDGDHGAFYCGWYIFFISTPGLVFVFAYFSTPAVLQLTKRALPLRNFVSLLLTAYWLTLAIGLLSTVEINVSPFVETTITVLQPRRTEDPVHGILYFVTGMAPFLAISALLLGWRYRLLQPHSLLGLLAGLLGYCALFYLAFIVPEEGGPSSCVAGTIKVVHYFSPTHYLAL
jgi:hypothetical protein